MIRQVPADTSLISNAFDTYDYLAFAFLLIAIIAVFSMIIWILGLPGKIAIQRRHPHAITVKLMGWAGALAVIPWIHAFIWAYHDSMTVDIRRFPEEEKDAIDREIAELTKDDKKSKKVEIDRPTRLPDPTPNPQA
ncbi:MAG: DUF3302 domain-containing protein [Bauldia sp.]|nr:DUF3302 domain-containing protein [Bauldia sp.]